MSATQTAPTPGTAALVAAAEAAAQSGAPEAAREGYVSALRVLAASDPPALRVRALAGLGWTLSRLGDPAAALRWYEQAFATQRRTSGGDRRAMAALHGVMAEVLTVLGRHAEALAEHEAVLAQAASADASLAHGSLADGTLTPGTLAPDAGEGLSRARTHELAGEAAARAKRYPDARAHQDAALGLLRGLLPPGDPRLADALSKLGYSLLELKRWPEAEAALRESLAIAPGQILVTTNLVHVLVKQGHREEARTLAQEVYREQSFSARPAPADTAGTLLLLTALEGNIPSEHLLSRLPLTLVDWHVDFSDATHEARLPRHDAVLNLIGDADAAGVALRYAGAFAGRCAVPLLNDPAQVQRTGRHMIPDLLDGIDGLVVPRAVRLSGADLAGHATLEAHGLRLPVLLRAAGRHGGETVRRIESAAALDEAAAALAADATVYLTQYHDYASPDGLYRKYRAIFVDRVPMPYHLAISPHWLVHYFSAEMDHDDRMAEEQAFLADMPLRLGRVATAALDAIARRLDLDYCGADFSLLEDGRILLFESNATMLVHPEPPDSRHAAKNSFIDPILLAFDAMVMGRAGLRMPAS